jgi:hypothetical protein
MTELSRLFDLVLSSLIELLRQEVGVAFFLERSFLLKVLLPTPVKQKTDGGRRNRDLFRVSGLALLVLAVSSKRKHRRPTTAHQLLVFFSFIPTMAVTALTLVTSDCLTKFSLYL